MINNDFIRNFTKENLWQLDKTDVQNLATSLGIEYKSSETKSSLLDRVKKHEDFDLLDVYNKFKKWCFGIYPTKAQELLNIDNATLKKLAKKEVFKVAYTRRQKLYGKYIDVPYYLLESLIITEEDLAQAIEAHCKKATDKQLESLAKARAVSEKNRTCSKCGAVETHKKHLNKDGWCRECVEEDYREYQRALQFNRKKEIEGYCREFLNGNYVILDTESTGLDFDDKIVEIGIIDMKGNVLLDTLIHTDKEISEGAYMVNGISQDDLIGKPTIESLTSKLDEILIGKNILAYNAAFDRSMLRQSGYKNKKLVFNCLMNLYTEYLGEERWVSLADALHVEKIKINQKHRAIDDCFACLELIKVLANK